MKLGLPQVVQAVSGYSVQFLHQNSLQNVQGPVMPAWHHFAPAAMPQSYRVRCAQHDFSSFLKQSPLNLIIPCSAIGARLVTARKALAQENHDVCQMRNYAHLLANHHSLAKYNTAIRAANEGVRA
eukprot:Pompholyxophrys_punicea_v1_NODE_908_length_1148_cov_2.150046.p2 type:complete len:126 gc:universal NODE_908_length_1148_cov_2.150046:234-611(+)